jgi:hypothetical protein
MPPDAGICFREVMRGPFALGEVDPSGGERAGLRAGTELALHARLAIADVKGFVADAEHRGVLDGSVTFAPLGTDLPVRNGVFQLFTRVGASSLKQMVYRATFEHGGDAYTLHGAKHVGRQGMVHSWKETTTLYCTLHAGGDRSGRVVGAGVLRLTPAAFTTQLLSFGTVNGGGAIDRAGALSRFFLFFATELIDTYVKPRTADQRKE